MNILGMAFGDAAIEVSSGGCLSSAGFLDVTCCLLLVPGYFQDRMCIL